MVATGDNMQMTACIHLGAHHYERGAHRQASELFETARKIAQEVLFFCVVVDRWARTHKHIHMHRARARTHTHTHTHTQLGNRDVQMKLCINLGACYFGSNRHSKAAAAYEQAKVIAQDLGNRQEQMKVHVSLGACYGSLRQFDKSIMLYKEAIKIADEIGELDWKSKALNGMVKCKVGLRSMQAKTSVDRGDHFYSLKQHGEAIRNYEEARSA